MIIIIVVIIRIVVMLLTWFKKMIALHLAERMYVWRVPCSRNPAQHSARHQTPTRALLMKCTRVLLLLLLYTIMTVTTIIIASITIIMTIYYYLSDVSAVHYRRSETNKRHRQQLNVAVGHMERVQIGTITDEIGPPDPTRAPDNKFRQNA